MRTDFVHWYPLGEAGENAPEAAGVFQIRIPDGLLAYPKGKSAMVHYGSAANLRDAIAELARGRSPQERHFLCRHQSTTEPAVLLQFVLDQFVRRFGVAPSWPESQEFAT